MTQPDAIEPDPAQSATPPSALQQILAEALGTYVLVFIGCGAIAFAANPVAVTLSFGLAYAVAYAAFARLSGGYFNPALTVGAALGGRLAWRSVGGHVGAQFAGATAAALTLFVLLFGFAGFDAFDDTVGANVFGDEGTGYAWWAAILLEIVMTLIFVVVVLGVTDTRAGYQSIAPLLVGFTLAAITAAALATTLVSLNPARSFGPALFTGTDALIQLPVFLIAPLIGGAAGGLLYPLLFGHDGEPAEGSGIPKRTPKPAAQGGYDAAAWTGEPIIQNGWQWDPAAQQWIPANQAPQATPGPQAPQAAPAPEAEQTQQPPAQSQPPAASQWPTGDDDGRTQIRPDSHPH